jgi:sirohydrochlorin cobaltochelatase
MKHIVLTAFGASESAQTTYRFLGSYFSTRFPDARLHWSISSPSGTPPAFGRTAGHDNELAQVLDQIPVDDQACCIVQPLHLTPGLEFHRAVRTVYMHRPGMAIGAPLLSSQGDFHRLVDRLTSVLPDTPDQGVLLIGHGTTHPSWTTLPVLEQLLRATTRSPVFLAVLQHFPDSHGIIEQMVASTVRHWLVIPLLLATGKHFQRDIAGPEPHSWSSRLQHCGLAPVFREEGLGMLPGIAEMFGDHIQDAFDRPIDSSGSSRQPRR